MVLDHMKALRVQFFTKPDCGELRQEIREIHGALVRGMDKEHRRRLLKLIDLESELRDEVSLASFLSGFKLAWGITQELGVPYSFEVDEEQRASELLEKEVGSRG
ncbi:hypothetical protein [Dysosmobacter sp.]